ncbi:MAG: hypothetical protein ATN35_06020 [Epulopiscium sp. Nele67-Bin004]|nr:MAG: hypothetical protein ATN35_06020 [Epulopiscium sp. Nele67-Bin004]
MPLEQTETVPNRFKFNGQQYDPISQQYYLRARYYNPVIARFTQEDTYRGDGLNLYAYCKNNPVSYVDPSGFNKCPSASETVKNTQTNVVQTTQNNTVENYNTSNSIDKGAPEPQVQNFMERFSERYPDRDFESGHIRIHSDGRENIEIDFETDNVIIEFKEGNGKGLTRQVQDRLDPMINSEGKVVIGVSGSSMSPHVKKGVEEIGGLMTNNIELLLDLIKPDK